MKLLLTINDLTITGGAERVCVNLANALADSGVSVDILSFYRAHSSLPYALSPKVKLHFWHLDSESHFAARISARPLGRLYYKNLYKFILSLRVWWRYKGISAIIVSDWTFTPHLRRARTRYIKILHFIQAKYAKRNNCFDTLICLTHSYASRWQGYHKHLKVIPNFLPTLPAISTDSSQKVVLSVGRLSEEKGFLRLIDIWECVKQSKDSKGWQLVIVGDGELREQIESKIHAKKLQDSITLKPFTKDIESEYLKASIYVMTSHFEGFGMVLVEASSYALPCIAFDIPTGPSDIIESSVSGYLIEDNDLKNFATKTLELMNDESRRKALGANAKERVKAHFSKESILPLWEEVLYAK